MIRLALAALAAAALFVGTAAPADAARLTGTVSGDRTITLKKRNGTVVRTLAPGRHTFVIRDRSSIHNFVLARGPNRIRGTGISFVGTETWQVRIRRGAIYRYFCQTHTAQMSKTFRVS